jgi:hypothetical protein
MAMKLRSDLGLPTLRILLDAERTSIAVVFQIVRGGGTRTEVVRCTLGDLGLPENLAGAGSIRDADLKVPSRVMEALSAAVKAVGPSPMQPESALWLEFPSPRGFLYVVPWERLLEPLGRCMFRLPNHMVRPEAPGSTLEVAICASTPLAKEGFEPIPIMVDLTASYLRHTGRDATVHLFADAHWVDALRAEISRESDLTDHVVVHDPAESAPLRTPTRTATLSMDAEVVNPWLTWIMQSMAGRPLDIVHFLSHGHLTGDLGAIAVARRPTLDNDREMARFIGSIEMTTFLSQVGAWGLMLSGPPNNVCEAGLRQLADAVAMVLPGVALTHDVERDPRSQQLGVALATIFSSGSPLDGPLPAMTCWVHPRFVETDEAYPQDLYLEADGSSAFISASTRDALAHTETESWVASASRYIERQQVRWIPDSPEESADPAAVTALTNVAALVERHVVRAYPSSGPSRGDDA